MDRRRLRKYAVRAFAALAIATGFTVGGAVLAPAQADEVVWIKPATHRVPVSSTTPSQNSPRMTADEVVWI